jgi:integrase
VVNAPPSLAAVLGQSVQDRPRGLLPAHRTQRSRRGPGEPSGVGCGVQVDDARRRCQDGDGSAAVGDSDQLAGGGAREVGGQLRLQLPRTVETYRWLLRRHVLPHLGAYRLPALTRADVRAWNASLCASPGPTTAAKSYRLLAAIYRTAVEDELVVKTPCTLRGAGQEYSPERPLLTVGQVLALADAVGPRWRATVLLAAFGCLRFGEIAALRRDCLDLDAHTVRVVASVRDLPGGVRHVGPPKSRAGRRVVVLPDAVVPDLREHAERFAEPAPDGLVFVGPKGGPLRGPGFGTSVWRPATVAVGLPGLHFHDLRHTGATLAASTGATLAELMARLGHSSVDAAMRYQHASRERDAVIAAALSALLRKEQSA